MANQRFGPYLLQEKLGSGGMGSVYRAIHETTGQPVAVKLIAEQVADSERFRRRFLVEVETLKKLNHPNIVRLIGYGEEQGVLFYSMEVVDGLSLQQYLREHKRLDWRLTIDIAIDICAALKHAHDLGVIHRDLKPANLLLDDQRCIHLVDFGIAKLFGAGDHTAAGSVLGTADFMAPEQAGEGKITTRTDLYALGSVLYACLAGRAPFGGKSITTVIDALRRETPVALDLIVPETPEELTELIHQLLEKAPEKRPPTALVVGNRLRAMRAGLQAREAQTASDLGQPTQVESPTDSTDLEIDPAFVIPSERPTVAPQGRTASPGSDGDPLEATLDVTLDSAPGQVPTRPPTLQSAGPQPGTTQSSELPKTLDTSFRTVDEMDRGRGLITEEEPPEIQVVQLLSIGGLILVLAVMIGLSFFWLRTPTSDKLFESIEYNAAAGNYSALRRDVSNFTRAYPDDPRIPEIQSLTSGMDMEGTIRRLRLAGLKAGGIQHLSPLRQAFLEAAMLREQDPAGAVEKFSQWLAVFGHEGGTQDLETQRLQRLAISEMERLHESAQLQPVDTRAQALQEQMNWAAENLPAEELKEFYRGLILLYENKAWAEGLIREAKEHLNGLLNGAAS